MVALMQLCDAVDAQHAVVMPAAGRVHAPAPAPAPAPAAAACAAVSSPVGVPVGAVGCSSSEPNDTHTATGQAGSSAIAPRCSAVVVRRGGGLGTKVELTYGDVVAMAR
jgi:hypothetical protein